MEQYNDATFWAIMQLYTEWLRIRRSRRWGVRPINQDRLSNGYFQKVFLPIKSRDPEQFFIHTRMTRQVYDLLLNLVSPYLQMPGQIIGAEERLCITLNLKLTTPIQFSILVEELEKLPDLARGTPVFGTNRIQYENEWERIRGKLNSNGPPIRSTAEWKKQSFLKLENITLSMRRPCVMDIKMGKRTWDPLATPKKRNIEEGKYGLCKKTLGLCIPGFQVYPLNSSNVLRYDKDFGKQLNPENVHEVFELFFNESTGAYPPLVLQVLSKLYKLRRWFNKQTSLKFYSSSILIAYDCHTLSIKKASWLEYSNEVKYSSESGELKICHNKMPEYACYLSEIEQWIEVKMIDFAHVFLIEDSCLDRNYLFGLQSLINIIEKNLRKTSQYKYVY